MAPSPFRQMVVHAQRSPALGTCDALARRVAHTNIKLLPRDVQFGSLHRPRRRHSKELSVQLYAVHRTSPLPIMRESVLPTHRNVCRTDLFKHIRLTRTRMCFSPPCL